MDISIITGPIIGATIGYFTNYIAVKMLFYPLHPVKIGKRTLIFTPGIIPKERPRLAKAIGGIIGTELVSEKILEPALTSTAMKSHITEHIYDSLRNSSLCLSDLTRNALGTEKAADLKNNLSIKIAAHIQESLNNAHAGELLSEEIIKSIKQHLQGGFLSMVINDSLLNTFKKYISDGITDYINNNAESLLVPYVDSEITKLFDTKLSETTDIASDNNIDFKKIIAESYERIIHSGLPSFLDKLNISALVEQEINSMDIQELEQLLLMVMKKELNAIVRLGAVIGFLLGLINILF